MTKHDLIRELTLMEPDLFYKGKCLVDINRVLDKIQNAETSEDTTILFEHGMAEDISAVQEKMRRSLRKVQREGNIHSGRDSSSQGTRHYTKYRES